MKCVTVSVPGKVHLMGEHAVVYGHPALLAAINLRLVVTINSQPSTINQKREIRIESTEPDDYVRHIAEVVREHFKLKEIPPLHIRISSQIPAGYHLGSSAAVAVATVGALTYFLTNIWNPPLFNQLAYEAEKKMHGSPSGGDNTAVTMGGFIWFRKELEFLKSIWQLPLKLPPPLDHFFLINTGRPKETTGEMVAFVASSVKRQASTMEKLFMENEEQTKRVAAALKEGDEAELIDAIRVGERTLEGMGVVSDTVLPLMRTVEDAGGAAKILGGGGRRGGVGCLLCYHHAPPTVEALCNQWGFTTHPIHLNEEGVRLEKT